MIKKRRYRKSQIEPRVRAVFNFLHKQFGTGEFEISGRTLAAMTGGSQPTIRSVIADLAKIGLEQRTSGQGGNPAVSSRYIVWGNLPPSAAAPAELPDTPDAAAHPSAERMYSRPEVLAMLKLVQEGKAA